MKGWLRWDGVQFHGKQGGQETGRSGHWIDHWYKYVCHQDRIPSLHKEDLTRDMRDCSKRVDCNCWNACWGSLYLLISIFLFSPQRFQRSRPKLSFQIYFSLFPFMHPIFYVTEMLAISKVYFFLNWPLAFAHAVGFYLKLHYYAH